MSHCLFCTKQNAFSAELILSEKIVSDKTFLSVSVDSVTLLAGMKITIGFDEKKYQTGELRKSELTRNFIHLVNRTQAGKAIVVMASANGTSGQDIDLFNLEMINLTRDSETNDTFKVLSCEMMDENLKAIPCQ